MGLQGHRDKVTPSTYPLPQAATAPRVWELIGGVSLRVKILGMVLALVLVLGSGVTLQVRSMLTRTLLTQLQEESVSLGRDLAARSTDPLLINDLYSILQLLRETRLNNPDVRYAFILDADGRVIAHTFSGGFPADLITTNTVATDAHHHMTTIQTEEGVIWDTAVPIFEGKAGTARIGLTEARMRDAVAAITTQLLLATGLVSLFGILAAIFLTWLLTRPVRQLVEATEAVRRGDYSPRVRRWADDELGELADAFNVMTADLATADIERQEREQMRAFYLRQIITAQEEERKRIARELHDETGQALASVMVGLRNVEEASSAAEVQTRLADLRGVASATLESVRRLALELRPSVLDDLGLVAALRRYATEYTMRFKIPVTVQIVGLDDFRLASEIETALYRIVQEALTNIAKYARATHVSVLLEHRDGQISAIVEDNGCGFDAEQVLRTGAAENRLGLYGMRERAELVGGALTVEAQTGCGTTVFVRVPVGESQTANGNRDILQSASGAHEAP
jgi:signal transduction histidine kinase